MEENAVKQFSDLLILDNKVYRAFKKEFLKAVAEKQKQFKFKGGDFLTMYAYYNLKYVEAEKQRMGIKLYPNNKKLELEYKDIKVIIGD
jgi:hypothetical protein